ncbi:MAG: type I 3-dehydroquinate dehydratase [Bacteroidales bacterium]|nr:type I 3-dehydroquinate dehydratase [Bacteroidales bacterium]
MICVAISEKKPEKCLEILDKVEMAEIRIDLTGYDLQTIARIFRHPTPTIATCRAESTGYEEQNSKLIMAIESGAKYVDIEIEVPEDKSREIIDVARKHGCKVIISYHNFNETPDMKELFAIADKCYARGAEIAKIATMANKPEDNARLMALYSISRPVVALGMGKQGKASRIVAPLMGAGFTFAAQDDGAATAPGQIKYSELKNLMQQIENVL